MKTKTVRFRATVGEDRMLRAMAKRHRVSVSELIANALRMLIPAWHVPKSSNISYPKSERK